MANVFTVGTTGLNVDHIVTGVKLYMWRATDPDIGVLTASIITTEQEDGIWAGGPFAIPTNTVLATGTILNSTVPFVGDTPSVGWVEINFTTTGLLKKNTTYVIVVKTNGGNCAWAYNYIGCPDDAYWMDLTYGGERNSGTEGRTWNGGFGSSCLYEEYGTDRLSKAWLDIPGIINLKSRGI